MSTSDFRRTLERSLGNLGRRIQAHPWLVLLASLAVFSAFAYSATDIKAQASFDAMLREDDPARIQYDLFRERFGRDELLLVALKPAEIFDLEFLTRLRDMHRDLEAELPHLEAVTSLVNVRETRGVEDGLVVDDLLADWPESEADLAALRERVLSSELYRNFLISEDGRVTMIIIEPAYDAGEFGSDDALSGFDDANDGAEPQVPSMSPEANEALWAAALEVLARHADPKVEVHNAGPFLMIQALVKNMITDMRLFSGLAILVIAISLFAMFRRLSAVIGPLVVVVMGLVSTLGLMAITGAELGMGTQLLPSFLLAVGVGYSVHILSIFYQAIDEDGRTPNDAMVHALEHSGVAVLFTGLTTAGGMISFAAAPLTPIRTLGLYAPAGIFLACAYTLVVLPAAFAIFPVRPRAGGNRHDWIERALLRCGDFAVDHPLAILSACGVAVAVSLTQIPTLNVAHDPIQWLPEDHPVRRGIEFVDREMGGSMSLEVLLDTEKENGLQQPSALQALDRVSDRLVAVELDGLSVSKASSIAEVVKEINQALHEESPAAYAIPANSALVAQELLLFENSGTDDLEDVVDSQFSLGRISLRAPWSEAGLYANFVSLLKMQVGSLREFGRVEFTGMLVIMSSTMIAVIETIIRSYGLALLIITPLMILLIGNLRIGVASMVPNLAPIVVVLGVMAFLGVRLDMFTMLVGSVALGLVVDDTVHFLHTFRRYFDENQDVRESVRETLRTTGRALVCTSLVLTAGFLIFAFSSLSSLVRFGSLTAFAIVTALLLDIFLSPALMSLLLLKRESPTEGVTRMKRRRLFEFNESERCPGPIRRAITRLLQWGALSFPLYQAAVPLARELLEAQDLKQVVDLGSGSGGPWPALLREPGLSSIRLMLTDRGLDPSALQAFDEEQRASVELGPSTQNLLAPEHIPGLRTAFACLHHLKPDELEAVFEEVASSGHPFLGVEVTERTASAVARQLLLLPAAFIGMPFIRPTLTQLVLTYLVPLIPLALTWDGVVSCLRSYSSDELLELATRHAPTDYQWKSGRVRDAASPSHVVYLMGHTTEPKGSLSASTTR